MALVAGCGVFRMVRSREFAEDAVPEILVFTAVELGERYAVRIS